MPKSEGVISSIIFFCLNYFPPFFHAFAVWLQTTTRLVLPNPHWRKCQLFFFQLSKNLLNKLFFYHRSLFSPSFCFYVAASIECRVPINSLTPRKVLWCEGWVELIYHWNARNVSHVTFRGWISFQVLLAFYRIPQPPLLTYICKVSNFCTLSTCLSSYITGV